VYCCQENPACLLAYLPTFLAGTALGAAHRVGAPPVGPAALSALGALGAALFLCPLEWLPAPSIDYGGRVIRVVQSRVHMAVPISYYEDTFCNPYKWLGVLAVLLAAAHDAPSLRWLAHPALGWLGDRSFGVYVWHYLVLGYLREGLGRGWLPIALYHALTPLAAHLSYEHFEAPMRRRIRSLAAPAGSLL
jgi:peptidoglycan/LPS O-acetylase OafA/YrhL